MFLRQSTSQLVEIGPFLDATDGVTEEVGLTPANTDIRLSKDGAVWVNKNSGGATHREDGWYDLTLDATDTATVGELRLKVQAPATHLPVWERWYVVEEAVYDALYAASAAGPLQSTVAGRTLDVTAAGEAGIDLDNTSGTLAAAQIASAALTADKFGADFITAASIADNSITSDQLGANAIGATQIATDAITAAKIAANAIGASELAADAIGDSQIATGAIATTAFAAGAIDNAAFNVTETLTANPASGGIVAASFGAGAIDATAIAADAITAAKVAADVHAEAADAIWDEPKAGHIGATTFGDLAPAVAAVKAETASIQAETTPILADTADMQPKLGAPAGASISVDIAAVKVDTAAILLDTAALTITGTASSGSTTTLVDNTRTEGDADYWKGMVLLITNGTIAGQARRITAYDEGTDTFTVDTAFTQAVGTNTYAILQSTYNEAPAAGSGDWSTAEKENIRSALGVDGTKTAASAGQLQGTLTANPAAGGIAAASFAAGAIDASAIATDAIGSAELAATAVAEIADQVWEEAIADHSGTGGSTAEQLAAAGAGGDPWATALPGAYGAGTAGKIVGDNVDAPISVVDTVVDGIQADLSNGTDGLGAIKADTAAVLVDTADMQPKLGAPAGASISVDIAAVKTTADGIQTDLDNGTDGLGAIKTETASIQAETTPILADTADMQPKLGAPAGASVSADILALKTETASIQAETTPILADTADMQPKVTTILADTDDIQTRIPAALVSGAMDSDVSAMQSGVITATAIAANAIGASELATDAIGSDQLATTAVDEIRDAILPKINTAYPDIPVLMVDDTDHFTPKTGLSLGVTRSIDGSAFGAGTGTAAEIANGLYQYDASAADMNGTRIKFRFTGTNADDRFITIRTGG